MSTPESNSTGQHPRERAALYLATFLLGAIVMSFEMLATRYLNPFFGSSKLFCASMSLFARSHATFHSCIFLLPFLNR